MRGAPVRESEPAWGRDDSIIQPSSPAFWLAVALFAMGAFLLNARVGPALSVNIGAASLTLVLWALYALPFVALIAWLDLLEPEPPAFLASAFTWGALAAASIAMVANSSTQSIMLKLEGREFTEHWWAALSGPSTEEPLKALGVVVIILVAGRQVNTVLDGLVYGMFVGLGFQLAENLVQTADKLKLAAFTPAPGRVVLDVFLLRGLALGLWSHAVYTGLVGFGIAYAYVRTDVGKVRRGLVAVGLFAVAWTLHFLWNAPFLQPDHRDGLAGSDIGLYVVKGLPAALLVVALVRLAWKREAVWIGDALREDPDVSPEEIDELTSARASRSSRAEAQRQGGRRARRAVRRRQQAMVALAVARTRSTIPDDPAVEQARTVVRDARAEASARLAVIPEVADQSGEVA